ncbi:MAG: cation diffusion facilitator family transporter, partial [Nitrospinae bacterium]|nr:cation diffusion facilitator family transporter [Nitrospinota bacterium]
PFPFFFFFIKVLEGGGEAPASIAVLGAIFSITINELMYRYQSCVGRELNSPALKANAWDNRSDALSSVGVLFGIVGAIVGFPILDQLAAMFVAMLVAKIGMELMAEAMKGLMDSSIELDELKEIYKHTQEVKGVKAISYIRGRSLGEQVWIDVEIEVNGNITVEESEVITNRVKAVIHRDVEHVGEVMVYLKGEEKSKGMSSGMQFWKNFVLSN